MPQAPLQTRWCSTVAQPSPLENHFILLKNPLIPSPGRLEEPWNELLAHLPLYWPPLISKRRRRHKDLPVPASDDGLLSGVLWAPATDCPLPSDPSGGGYSQYITTPTQTLRPNLSQGSQQSQGFQRSEAGSMTRCRLARFPDRSLPAAWLLVQIWPWARTSAFSVLEASTTTKVPA